MDAIKILGVRDHLATNRLCANVEKALSDLNIRLQPKLIDEVDQLLAHKVEHIPALVVKGQIVSQRYIPQSKTLKTFFKSIFLPEKKVTIMKNIIVPTDFSRTSKYALDYARALAQMNGAAIKVVHVLFPQVNNVESMSVELFERHLSNTKKRLASFVRQDPARMPDGDIAVLTKIETDITVGFPGDKIIELSNLEETDMVVMGTTGENGFLEKVFGSISTQVARRAGCPVLLIPDGLAHRPCQNILFATDDHMAIDELVQKIPYLLACPTADIHLVHVNKTKEPVYQVEDLCFYNPRLEGQFHFVQIESENVIDGLNRYAEEKQVDAMVMVTNHRPFFENIFHKSTTKQMVLNTDVPLLVMHSDG